MNRQTLTIVIVVATLTPVPAVASHLPSAPAGTTFNLANAAQRGDTAEVNRLLTVGADANGVQ